MTLWMTIEEDSTMKFQITAVIADLFNSFCEEVYVVAFFKEMRQQTGWSGKFNYVFLGR